MRQKLNRLYFSGGGSITRSQAKSIKNKYPYLCRIYTDYEKNHMGSIEHYWKVENACKKRKVEIEIIYKAVSAIEYFREFDKRQKLKEE